MKGYQELAQKIVFNFNDAFNIFKNKTTTYGALSRLEKQDLIKKVRNNLYVSINPSTGNAFATKYQIGSSINNYAYISHSSALEYYGYQNQVGNICYVSSYKRFNSFEYEGVIYKHVPIKSNKGVTHPSYTELIKITDIEKTVIDAIQALDSIISLEELINSLEMISRLDQHKIMNYLDDYSIQALYQRTGYLLMLFNETLKFSESFFENIKEKINKSVSYISNEAKYNGKFIKEYQIIVPEWLEGKAKLHEI
ncbi:MAG TPA: type IV toxin-antitoxin system AbiEi family antitoxin [Bacilli bacterium]|nr:type IV toxin-antitoxin system AbiEi family antitoxin [Bacilli bacterium]